MRHLATCIVAAAIFAVCSQQSSADVTGVAWSNTDSVVYDGFDYSNYSIGWSFTVGASNLEVTQFGMFDLNGDGVTGDQRVRIFNSGGSPVSPVVTITNADALDGATHFRWETIPGVALTAGQLYYISSKAPQGGAAGSGVGFTGLTFGSGITYNAANFTSTGDSTLVAATSVSGNPFGWFGPNLQYLVPEPASIALLAGGAMLMLRRRATR